MNVLFLGTGNAISSGGRYNTAILLRGSKTTILLDCGPHTLLALQKNGISPKDIDTVAISHHHGDHFGGLPFLLLHESLRARGRRFCVIGPENTSEIVDRTTRLFYPKLNSTLFPFEICNIRDKEQYAVEGGAICSFVVRHFSTGQAFGYRVELDGRVIVFSGDTAWTDELIVQSKGADLFICECSSLNKPIGRHITHRDLIKHRDRIEAVRTVLVHPSDEVISNKNQLVFELASDGMQIEL